MAEEAKRCVDALRICHSHKDCRDCRYVERDRDEMSCVNVLFVDVADLIESMSAELEQVKRERDAAVEDLSDHGMLCVLCMHENKAVDEEPCKSCSHASTVNRHTNWQWRGVKEEKDEPEGTFAAVLPET